MYVPIQVALLNNYGRFGGFMQYFGKGPAFAEPWLRTKTRGGGGGGGGGVRNTRTNRSNLSNPTGPLQQLG